MTSLSQVMFIDGRVPECLMCREIATLEYYRDFFRTGWTTMDWIHFGSLGGICLEAEDGPWPVLPVQTDALAEMSADEMSRYAVVSYCPGKPTRVSHDHTRDILRTVYRSLPLAVKAYEKFGDRRCSSACRDWHTIEQALPTEQAGDARHIPRQDYAKLGLKIPCPYYTEHEYFAALREASHQHPVYAFPRPAPASYGFVYLIEVQGTRYIKIGRGKNVDERLRALQISTPFPLSLLREIRTCDAVKLEALLHRRYKRYCQRGEWFDLPDNTRATLLQKSFDLLDTQWYWKSSI